ncbi:hypothetical protein ACNTMW_19010, partial [Planosporangium sp. 12N6]|uniref:hypothetical protein n=1 Tax=Planosporangium spinosum TaxID=3402278 RepID=UPI003CF8901D
GHRVLRPLGVLGRSHRDSRDDPLHVCDTPKWISFYTTRWDATQPSSVDGFCQQCGRTNQLYPCPPSRLALQGLAYACGVPADAGGWAEYLRRRHRQTGRW